MDPDDAFLNNRGKKLKKIFLGRSAFSVLGLRMYYCAPFHKTYPFLLRDAMLPLFVGDVLLHVTQ